MGALWLAGVGARLPKVNRGYLKLRTDHISREAFGNRNRSIFPSIAHK